MKIEDNLKLIVEEQLKDGLVEDIVRKKFEQSIESAIGDLFGSYGDITRLVREQIKDVLVPYIESHDYSDYVTKLDSVLVEVIKNTTSEHEQLLKNFKDLATDKMSEEITVEDLYHKYMDYVGKNVDTTDLEVNLDDEPSYENVTARFHISEMEHNVWSNFKHAMLVFECEEDEELNLEVNIMNWKGDGENKWSIYYNNIQDISSLRTLSEFEILLMKLNQYQTLITIDDFHDECEVMVDEQPEPTF